MLILLLINIPITFSRCWNQSGSCTTFPCSSAGSCINFCPNGCKGSNIVPQPYNSQPYNFVCTNTTQSNPVIRILEESTDFSCKPIQNSNDSLPLIDTNYMCNPKGSICPYGCFNNNGTCEAIDLPSRKKIICQYIKDWKCPEGCAHNKGTNECYPKTPNDICKLIPENLLCPSNCVYDYHLSKCMSSNPNYVCEFKIAPFCPAGCMTNIRGDMCIPGNPYRQYDPSLINFPYNLYPICEQLSTPKCRLGCEYNIQSGLCQSVSLNSYTFCEDILKVGCDWPPYLPIGERYAINVSMLPSCTKNNASDICFDLNYGILYPKRLESKYNNTIKCAFSNISCPIQAAMCCG
jgi:hypothetical protein